MKQETPTVAVLCADLHLSLRPPVARSCEEDWLAVQIGYLRQLDELAAGKPVLIAGDVFDKWSAPAELIALACRWLPHPCFCVPGNHDLPAHCYEDRHKSAYGVLVASKRITDLRPHKPVEAGHGTVLRLHGFPPGFKVRPLETRYDLMLEVAVAHDYIWSENRKTGYPGASEESKWHNHVKNLRGYDVAAFGDNHNWFSAIPSKQGAPRIWNCGTFMRRKMDERDYQPCVGLLHSDGTVERMRFNVEKDKFIDVADPAINEEDGERMAEFIAELERLQDHRINFGEAVVRWLRDNDVPGPVRAIALKAIEQ